MGDVSPKKKKKKEICIFFFLSHIVGFRSQQFFLTNLYNVCSDMYKACWPFLSMTLVRMTQISESNDRFVAAEYSACVMCFQPDNGISRVRMTQPPLCRKVVPGIIDEHIHVLKRDPIVAILQIK